LRSPFVSYSKLTIKTITYLKKLECVFFIEIRYVGRFRIE
jgi:hypothetical protein